MLFPEIANRNNAGDSPSHLVSKFFTVKGVHRKGIPTRTRITHGFVVYERPLERHRRIGGEWNKTQNQTTVDDVQNNTALIHPRTWLLHSTMISGSSGSPGPWIFMFIAHAAMPAAKMNVRYSEYLRTSFSMLQQLLRLGSTVFPSNGVSSVGSISCVMA